ncbi:MAG: AAA family ATPase, partial [Clostridium sp.]|nr:AAA family ATPase [Clostridium sp.]
MELIVENIGKIDKARVEVNGMTVITGYNGTGKSSLCRSLYSIMNTFSNINQKVFEQRKNSLMSMIYNWEEYLLDDGLEQETCEKMVIMLMDFMEESQDWEEEGILFKAIEDTSKLLNITIEKETINILQKKYKDIVKKDKDEYMRFIIARNIRDIFRNQMAHVNHKKEKSMIELKDERKIWNIVYEANALA